MNEIKPEEKNKLATVRANPAARAVSSFVRSSHEHLVMLSTYLAKSTIIPKDFQGKPENCYIAMSMGEDVGIRGIQALQNIMVVNGRPSLWGDVVLAIAKTSPDVEWISEDDTETVKKNMMGRCEVKLVGMDKTVVRTFSKDDAVTAGLWGKKGYDGKPTPWVTYPYRMLAMRARAFAIRDAIPHALKGLSIIEEQEDVPQYLTRSRPSEIKMPERTDAPVETAAAPSTEYKPPSDAEIKQAFYGDGAKEYLNLIEDYGIREVDLFEFVRARCKERPLSEIAEGKADDLNAWIRGELA